MSGKAPRDLFWGFDAVIIYGLTIASSLDAGYASRLATKAAEMAAQDKRNIVHAADVVAAIDALEKDVN